MKKWIVGVSLFAFCLSGFAGFVDERQKGSAGSASTSGQPGVAARNVISSAGAGAGGGVGSGVAAVAPALSFSVSATDKSVREVLVRWAAAAGWSHGPEHWAIENDHTIAGAAGPEVFGSDFKQAVRTLISSTELTEQPAQPCFYSNFVLRVIPGSGVCDRTAQ